MRRHCHDVHVREVALRVELVNYCSRIFDDLRDGQPYKVCTDETSGRIFVDNWGDQEARNRPRSSGVEYCTWSHARNQSRRERRRETRANRGAD
jgi:hypothetical protein